MQKLIEIYNYREMIHSLVRRDLKGRYKGSVLGFLWTFLNPLLQLLVYTLVFSTIMRNGIKDYYLFLFVALIPWIYFSTCVSGGCSCILSNSALVDKIYFPREVLPISYTLSQLVNMLLSFIIVFAVLILSGKGLNPIALLFLPILILIETLMALGVTFLFSGICVYFRDLIYFLGIATMAWQFLTPVMYGIDMVPEELQNIFYANPMTSVIIAYRDILYYKQNPHMNTLIMAVVFGVSFLILGICVFEKTQRHFAENM